MVYLTTRQKLQYIAMNDSTIGKYIIGKDFERSGRCLVELLYRNLHGGTENYENSHLG